MTGSFGRPQIQTWLVVDARRGPAREARFLHTEERDIGADADLASVFADEIDRNQQVAVRPDAVAAVVGVDVLNWKLIRIRLSQGEPTGNDAGVTHQILHLARPLLDTVPLGAGR